MSRAPYCLHAGDDKYGHICPDCAGPKDLQASRCQTCWFESRRGDAYWIARTCECGNTKHSGSATCKPCANQRLVGNTFARRKQPMDHPWRLKDELLYRRAR